MITKTNGNKNTPKCLLSPIQEENGTICEFQLGDQRKILYEHFQTVTHFYKLDYYQTFVRHVEYELRIQKCKGNVK